MYLYERRFRAVLLFFYQLQRRYVPLPTVHTYSRSNCGFFFEAKQAFGCVCCSFCYSKSLLLLSISYCMLLPQDNCQANTMAEENLDNESLNSSSSESISDKAEEELAETGVYQMILLTDVSRGVSGDLDDLSKEDALILARIEGELLARYAVDKSFADQLMKDESFFDEIKAMRAQGTKYDEKGKMTYVLCLHSALDNRYEYLCALSVWVKRRWLYLTLNAEREGLEKFFLKQCDRFAHSIPPVPTFRMWTMNIEDIKKDYETNIAKMASKRPTTSCGPQSRRKQPPLRQDSPPNSTTEPPPSQKPPPDSKNQPPKEPFQRAAVVTRPGPNKTGRYDSESEEPASDSKEGGPRTVSSAGPQDRM